MNLWYPNDDTVALCHNLKIIVQAASPFHNGRLLKDLVVRAIASRHKRPTAQILLRWSLQNGCVPLPRSRDPRHLEENLQTLDFELTDCQMGMLDRLDLATRGEGTQIFDA